jgi:myo-inositol-1-phosphate synthase
MEIKEYQNPITEIVAHVKQNVEKIKHPLAELEHKAGHLEESINQKRDEKTLLFEEDIVERILKSPNTEKLLEYIINNPRTKKICTDIAEEKVKELKQEIDDYKQMAHNLLYCGVVVTVAWLLITTYA